ncbi:MAG: family 10 glycosylhydrolase [Kiritimatiellae bacterium]|nr:family 10 glycosylhydrolase [Kiritimatiellia bacterium]
MKLFFISIFIFLCSFLHAADIAVVKPHSSCEASSVGYASSLGDNVVRWLNKGGIECDVLDERNMRTSIFSKKLIFIFLCSKLNPSQVSLLKRYLASGGKICSFYGESPELATLLGVTTPKYVQGSFSKMVFQKGALSGSPKEITQDCSGFFYSLPQKAAGSVAAYWKGSSSYPALIKLKHGWWFTGILKGKGDELRKEQLMLAIVDSLLPGRWKRSQWVCNKNQAIASTRAIALRQLPRKGEIHGVWDHSGEGLYPGDWPRTIQTLKRYGITDLFLNVAGAGFAHYNSKILPRSSVFVKRGDQLSQCINAARGSGIKVHAWVLCFSSVRASSTAKADLAKKGWLLKNSKGLHIDYLDASNPMVQKYLLDAIGEIKNNYAVDGVHLDFVRWSEAQQSVTATPAVMARYNKEKSKFQNVFWAWKEYVIRKFVYSARIKVKEGMKRKVCFSVAVLPLYPSCVKSVGQNWIEWMDKGYVDYIVPMNYSQDLKKYSQMLQVQTSTPERAKKVISGIGVTANESRLNAVDVINEINKARQHGAAGVVLFDLNPTLTSEILPMLSLGLFR